MLSIDTDGAQSLLTLLHQASQDRPAFDSMLDGVLAANAFFIDFYSGWDGCDREAIRQAVRCFQCPEQLPAGTLAARMAAGFRQAVAESDLLESRLAWLCRIDPPAIGGRVLAFLPAGTPLDTVVHITVDNLNNAFVSGREIGVSLLKGMADQTTFEDAVSHEMHHIGVRWWSERDPVLQGLLAEHAGRSVAVMHVLNLLMEGMTNYYITPHYVFRAAPNEPPTDPYQARLGRLQREELSFFAQAGLVLSEALEPGAAYEPCLETFKSIALDMQEMMLPAGHYLGARMINIMEQSSVTREQIVACVKKLPEFLPLYNQSARYVGAYVFNLELVERFHRLWR